MPTPINLKKIFIEALKKTGETPQDIICTSIPLALMDKMSTLEEIQCYYLHSQPDKQHIPFIAVTKKHIYFHNNEGRDPTHIMIDTDENGVDFIPGVEVYPIKDVEPYNETTIEWMKALSEQGML